MEKLTTTQLIESTLSRLGAVQWNGDDQVLYDYPSQQANPHFHFAFDATTAIADATQVTVTLLGRGNNFGEENGVFHDLHITPLGVFPIDVFSRFLESLLLAKLEK